MDEIKFYGRGGQGAVVASVIAANAAFREGKWVQAFPFYGIERRGAPVAAYTRMDTKPIRARGQISAPTIVVVLDRYLTEALDITQGIKPGGIIVLNANKMPEGISAKSGFKVYGCDADAIAVKYSLGAKTAPIVNTIMLGAFSKASGAVKLESIVDAMPEKVPMRVEDNIKAAKEAYRTTVLL